MDSERKFIPISHVYAGTRYETFSLWSTEAADRYFDILKNHRSQVIMEFSGHDHFSDLRVHHEDLLDKYHNIFIAPSITPWYSNNPGVTSLELSAELVPQDLRSTFLNLNATIGQEESLPYDQLEFRALSYEEQWGIDELTSHEIYRLAKRLDANDDLHIDYIVRKIGLDPSIKAEFDKAKQIMAGKEIIYLGELEQITSMWP